MKLFFRKYGENKPQLIIVHGLYGSSDNWVSYAKKLSQFFEVFVIDQRNHGNSPHSSEHNYYVMANDLLEFIDDNNIQKAIFLGHSMGGKTVMTFANKYPNRVVSLIVVDISPVKYNSENLNKFDNNFHKQILIALNDKQILKAESRKIANEICYTYLKNKPITEFLLKNLKRTNNQFQWKLNVDAITNNIEKILESVNFENPVVGFPCLFIKGERSNYITTNDIRLISKLFPTSEIITIKNATHWVHTDQPEIFLQTVINFCLVQ